MGIGVTNVLSRKVGSLPLQGVKNIDYYCDGPYNELTVKWEDPEDLLGSDGRVLEKWGKTVLVQKEGSAPTHPRDGRIVGYSTQRNQHRETPLSVNPSMDVEQRHYFQFFVYNSRGKWNKAKNASFELFFPATKTHFFRINFFDDPSKTPVVETATGGKSGNELDTSHIFREIKPCVFKNGQVRYFLKWKNFREKENGGAANLTGADGDVMIRFPKIRTFGSFLTNFFALSIAEMSESTYGMSGWGTDPYGLRGSYMYIGAFPGQIINGKLRSVANGERRVKGTLEQLRSAARANGQGYNILPLPALMYLRWLYIIRYGNLASAETLSVGGGMAGGTIDVARYGMDYKGSEREDRMRFLGLENINCGGEWVNGLRMGPNQKMLFSKDLDFNNPSSFRVDNEGRFTPLEFNSSSPQVLGLPGGPELFIRKGFARTPEKALDSSKLSFNEGNIVYGGGLNDGFLGIDIGRNYAGARLFYA